MDIQKLSKSWSLWHKKTKCFIGGWIYTNLMGRIFWAYRNCQNLGPVDIQSTIIIPNATNRWGTTPLAVATNSKHRNSRNPQNFPEDLDSLNPRRAKNFQGYDILRLLPFEMITSICQKILDFL